MPQLPGAVYVRIRLEVSPALVAVVVRVHHDAVDGFALRVDRVHHVAPYIEVLLVAGEQERIDKSEQAQMRGGAIDQLTGLRHDDREDPAVNAGIPLTGGAADLAIQADLAGDDSPVGAGA